MQRVRTAFVAGMIAWACAPMQPGLAQTARFISNFSDWSSYAHDDPASKTCFAVSQPKSQEPKNVNRDAAYFYISAWPRDGVKTEVSIKIGYPFKKGSDVTVNVGTASFKLFTQSDRAFVSDPDQELKLIEAMRKGTTMQVQGTSERGTTTSDSYSLAGLSQAMQALTEQCP